MTETPKIDSVPITVEELLRQSAPGTREAFERASDALEAAALIRDMRLLAGLSQTELAARLGVSPPRVSVIEKGDGPQGPTYALLKRVARVCGFDFDLSRALVQAKSEIPVTVEVFAQEDEAETAQSSKPMSL
jgi:transcriptional regulator with XRE-family HTH domain